MKLSKLGYAAKRTLTDPLGTLDEFKARRADPRAPESSVASLRYLQIGGGLKCGIMFVQSLLDSSPGMVNYPHDSQLTGMFFPRLRGTKNPSEHANFLNWLHTRYLSNAGVQRQLGTTDWERQFTTAQIARIRTNMTHLLQSGLDFWDLHAAFLDAYIAEFPVEEPSIWLDQSPFAYRYFDEIKTARPDAKFIHVLRHPAGTLSSKAIKLIRKNSGDQAMEELTKANGDFIRESFEFAAKNKDREGYLVVRFEDLCANPKTELERVCQFIGIPFHQDMLRPTLGGFHFPGISWEGIEHTSISAESIDRWRRRLPLYYINAVCYPVAELMKWSAVASAATLLCA